MAVVSFSTSEKVANNSSLQARLISELRLEDTVLVDPAQKVKTHFYELTHILTGKLVPEEDIINTQEFETYVNENDNKTKGFDRIVHLGVEYIAPDGYPVIKASSKKRIMKAFDHLPEYIDAVVVVQNDFAFEEVSYGVSVGGFSASSAGFGKQAVRSTISIYIVNRDGKKIFHRAFTGISDEKLGSKNNEFTLDQLAEQALDKSFAELNLYLIKKLKG